MTICIAALAESGKKVVLVADQMISANIPISLEYETDDVQKIYWLTDNAVVMTAGNALFAYEIVKKSKDTIEGQNLSTIEGIAEAVRQSYQAVRLSLIVREFIEPRGLSLEEYYKKQQELHVGIVQEIDSKLATLNIGVDLIVAGHNDRGECHIFSVRNPGNVVSHDPIGYACVGIGAPHATYFLIGSNYSRDKSLDDVEKLVRKAKKKSELAPGVGKATTITHLPKQDA